MNLKIIEYDYSKISVKNSDEEKSFKEDVSVNRNIIYFFYKDEKCLYVGETKCTLADRCYKNTPKHSEKDWFKEANKIYIIELGECIDDIARQALESTFILAYRPENNRKA